MEQVDIVRRAIEKNVRWMLVLVVGCAVGLVAYRASVTEDTQVPDGLKIVLLMIGIFVPLVFLENLIGLACNYLKFKQELVRPGSTAEKPAYKWAEELIRSEAWDAAQERASTWRLGKLVTRAEFLGNLEKYSLKESDLKDPSLISSP